MGYKMSSDNNNNNSIIDTNMMITLAIIMKQNARLVIPLLTPVKVTVPFLRSSRLTSIQPSNRWDRLSQCSTFKH